MFGCIQIYIILKKYKIMHEEMKNKGCRSNLQDSIFNIYEKLVTTYCFIHVYMVANLAQHKSVKTKIRLH